MADTTPSLELIYFGLPGRGEASRLALTIGGIPFKNTALDFPTFKKRKEAGTLSLFGQVPVLIVDGKIHLSQSTAIHRYTAKMAGLYPKDDDLLAARVDEFLYGVEDLRIEAFRVNTAEAGKEFSDGVGRRMLTALDTLAKRNAESDVYIIGDKLSIADISMYTLVKLLRTGFKEHVDPSLFEEFPRLISTVDAVTNVPEVMAYYKEQQ